MEAHKGPADSFHTDNVADAAAAAADMLRPQMYMLAALFS